MFQKRFIYHTERQESGRDAGHTNIEGKAKSICNESCKQRHDLRACIECVPSLLRREKITEKRRLWSMANDLLPYCREHHIPWCEKTESDEFQRRDIRDRLMRIILIYNSLHNP